MKDRMLLVLLVLTAVGISLLVEYVRDIIRKNKNKKRKSYS